MQNLDDLLKQIESYEIEYKLSKTKLSKDLLKCLLKINISVV